jgi:hypothetical protein
MTTMPESAGFVAFYRRYTKTWVHALAAAALTAFGTLSILHRGFVVLAVAAYVLPPLVLYFAWPALSGTRRLPGTDAAPAKAGPDPDRSTGETAGGSADEATAANDGTLPDRWAAVDAPTDAALHDAAVAAGDAYAVGEGGVVLTDDGDGWAVSLPDGPGAAANALHGVDATADGEAVWFAGDGGAVGRLERETGRHVDRREARTRGRPSPWVAPRTTN